MKEASSKRPNLNHDFLDFVDKTKDRLDQPLDDNSYIELRKQFEELQAQYPYDIPAQIEDISLENPQSQKISLRIVRPQNAQEALPMIYYIHGGGWVSASAQSYERILKTLAVCVNAAVVFPSYSLSPEAKYPTALNECYQALKYIVSNADEHKINAQKIAVVGDSAGGNLAAALTLMAKNKQEPKISFQMLLFPLTDLNLDTDTIDLFSQGPWISKESLKWYRKMYLENKGQRDDVYASPLLADYSELAGLAPTFIAVSENDPLRSDGEAYARKLNKANVDVCCVRYNGTIHNFIILNGLQNTQASKTATQQICTVLKEALK